jgi:hypothetical protein
MTSLTSPAAPAAPLAAPVANPWAKPTPRWRRQLAEFWREAMEAYALIARYRSPWSPWP